MAKRPDKTAPAAPTKGASPLDPARLAAALKANLARRKAQQRARATDPENDPQGAGGGCPRPKPHKTP